MTAEIHAEVPLAPLTTYKLGGAARLFAEPVDEEELRRVLRTAGEEVELLVLGRGSNVVVSDDGFDGLVVRLGGAFLEAAVDGDVLTAGAGMALPRVARHAAAHDRGGLEFFVGIPGSVGGAVRMNAGGHGTDTAAVLVDCRVLRRSRDVVERREAAALDLGYRTSNLGADHVVLGARFRTTATPRPAVEARLREITRWRKEHQPGGTLNAGSIFKNPDGDAAGRIIDRLGLKGYRRGAVSVSTMHANFFVAHPGATAQQVWDLVWDVRRRVADATGTWLEPEIRFAGRFAPVPDAGTGGAS